MSVAAYVKQIRVAADDGDGAPTGDWFLVPANTASLNQGGTLLDDTILGSHGYRSRLVGIIDWGVSMTVNFEPANDAIQLIRNAQLTRALVHVRYLPDGTLENGYQGPTVVETFNSSGGVDDLESVEVSLQSNGALGDAE